MAVAAPGLKLCRNGVMGRSATASLGGRDLAPLKVARGRPTIVRASSKKGAPPGVANTAQKAAWYGVELFGKVAGRGKSDDSSAAQSSSGDSPLIMDRSSVLSAIRKDYEVNKYFVSGQGDMSAYDSDCEFSDPFVSFNGVDRFKQNVSNLGAYLQDVELDILDWQESEYNVDVKWRFSCIIDLPWKPRLAAAGGTKHVLSSETGLVVKHIESWDVEVDKVLKSLVEPASKIPTNRWEVFMMALSSGDILGVWFALSGFFVAPSAALLGGSFLYSIVSGRDGLPAIPTTLCWALLLSSLVAEVQKLLGVGKGNGGRDDGEAL